MNQISVLDCASRMRSSGSSASNSLTEQSAIIFSSVDGSTAAVRARAVPLEHLAHERVIVVGEELTVCVDRRPG